jgi:hypothetical protein
MFLEVESADEFLRILEGEEGTDMPIFIGQMTMTNQGVATSYAVVQYQYDHDMIVRHKELAGASWLPRDQNDEEAKKSVDVLNKAVEEKTTNILKVLKDKGYTNIVHALWVSQ